MNNRALLAVEIELTARTAARLIFLRTFGLTPRQLVELFGEVGKFNVFFFGAGVFDLRIDFADGGARRIELNCRRLTEPREILRVARRVRRRHRRLIVGHQALRGLNNQIALARKNYVLGRVEFDAVLFNDGSLFGGGK